MKLTDFTADNSLNSLRNKMKAPFVYWDGFSTWNAFDPFGFRSALNEKGEVDIPFSEIKINLDDTLELFGKKILVYIRDQRGGYYSKYKFHIANCSTLNDAQKNNKYDKYVASVNTTNKFNVNIIHSNSWIEENKEVEMEVCKNCLSKLDFNNYKTERYRKKEIFENFTLDDFFKKYQKQSIIKPKYNSVTAPFNNYTEDFKEIADKLKTEKKYCCEECSLSLLDNKRFVHVHHIDSMKNNNKRENLKVVCIECHSKEPGHSHMRNLPDFNEFMKIKNGQLF